MIAPVPVHCFSITFTAIALKYYMDVLTLPVVSHFRGLNQIDENKMLRLKTNGLSNQFENMFLIPTG